MPLSLSVFFFFFNDTATTEIYTLSLHDALPISCTFGVAEPRPSLRRRILAQPSAERRRRHAALRLLRLLREDRKSTRLNSSHANISYAVFCLKKKKKDKENSSKDTERSMKIENI